MTDTQEYKDRLEEALHTISIELSSIARLELQTGDWVVLPANESNIETDENSEADGFEASEERQATLAELETTYRNIILALQKIKNGTYGVCEISGAPIEPERLALLPTARTCIAHKDDERMLPLA